MTINVTEEEVNKYLRLWLTLDNYVLQEAAITELFQCYYPTNRDLKAILIKVCVLNEFYSTQILDTTSVARHIHNLNIDHRLSTGNLDLVHEIAEITIRGNNRNNYSFASKYCSHHFPDTYAIYDSYVDKMLWESSKQSGFCEFKRKSLKSYPQFLDIIIKFRAHYNLEKYTIKQIDQFLWLLGKNETGKLEL